VGPVGLVGSVGSVDWIGSTRAGGDVDDVRSSFLEPAWLACGSEETRLRTDDGFVNVVRVRAAHDREVRIRAALVESVH
jgi:hypothetical protein